MLELQHISKQFGAVKALTGVSILFKNGEVHALCGENGAGKSTLMNVIAGNIKPDTGRILLNDAEVIMDNVQDAQELKIGMVHQERSLVNSLSVAENIFVKAPKTKMGLISRVELHRRTQLLLEELKLSSISPRALVHRLSAGEKQMVEIAKALAREPQILILDEPTASLTHTDTETLFSIIMRLKEKGVTIIYISHRMHEIKIIADVISVLKDGHFQGTFAAGEISIEQVINKMVGRELQKMHYTSHKTSEKKFEAVQLTGQGFSNASFSINKGEILGFAGLMGSGRTALALAIFGDRKFTSGSILKNGTAYRPAYPGDAIKNGVAYIPEDRRALGLFMERSISDNIVSAKLLGKKFDAAQNDKSSEEYRKKLHIRAASVRQRVNELSGGNQQKVVFAKWLYVDPDLLIINEPTHGVDVAAKEEIYRELRRMTAAGKSILLISDELPELLLLSDRIAVMSNGRIKGILENSEASEELIMAMASDI